MTLLSLPACREAPTTAGAKPAIDLLALTPQHVELETRRLVFPAVSRKTLLSGWSRPEWNRELNLGFAWATAPDADLSFRVLDVRELQFVVKLVPFPSVEPQHVTILVNGAKIDEIDPAPGFLEYRFVVGPASLRRGKNLLTFRHSILSRQTTDRDSRQFAAGYASLLVGPNCLPLRPRGEPPPPQLHDRDRNASPPQPLTVTGPAEFSYQITVPPAARLLYRIVLPDQSPKPARFITRLREGDMWSNLAVTPIRPSFLGYGTARELSVDLSPWSGKSVELRFGVYPEPCVAPLATIVLQQASVLGDSSASRAH